MFSDLNDFLNDERMKLEIYNVEENNSDNAKDNLSEKLIAGSIGSLLALLTAKGIKTLFNKVDKSLGESKFFKENIESKKDEIKKTKEENKEFKEKVKKEVNDFIKETTKIINNEEDEEINRELISDLNIDEFNEKISLIKNSYSDGKYKELKSSIKEAYDIITNKSIKEILDSEKSLCIIDDAYISITSYFVIKSMSKSTSTLNPEMLEAYASLIKKDNRDELSRDMKISIIFNGFYKYIHSDEFKFPEDEALPVMYKVATGKSNFLSFLNRLSNCHIDFSESLINDMINGEIIIQDFGKEENFKREFCFLLNRTNFVKGNFFVYKEKICFDVYSYSTVDKRWKRVYSDEIDAEL